MLKQAEQKWQLAGWISFVICSMLFIVDTTRSGNLIAVAANLIFLLACIQFIVPLVYGIRDANKNNRSLYDSEKVSE